MKLFLIPLNYSYDDSLYIEGAFSCRTFVFKAYSSITCVFDSDDLFEIFLFWFQKLNVLPENDIFFKKLSKSVFVLETFPLLLNDRYDLPLSFEATCSSRTCGFK